MKITQPSNFARGQNPLAVGWLVFNFAFLIVHSAGAASTNSVPVKIEPSAETARDFFNAGTRQLQAGKLREAEAQLQAALLKQDEPVQPAALFNLGQVRNRQGEEELKKARDGKQTAGRTRQAAAQAHAASNDGEAALASNDVTQMVEAYRRGRGARKDLKAATLAARKAMEVFGNVLLKWQRAAGDFQSAAELNPADQNAASNADIMNRRIAWLIDQIREMQQAMAAAAQAKQELGEKMKELKGKIPAPDAPPGGKGEGEEDDEGEDNPGDNDQPGGPMPEHEEGAGKTGEELKVSSDAAEQMLNGLRRDGDKRMPMGMGEEGKPKDPKRPNW